MTTSSSPRRYVICIRNEGYPSSLELKKVYSVLPDLEAETRGLLRVEDESGEDYLYPADFFVSIDVPPAAAKAFQ